MIAPLPFTSAAVFALNSTSLIPMNASYVSRNEFRPNEMSASPVAQRRCRHYLINQRLSLSAIYTSHRAGNRIAHLFSS